MTSSTPAPRFLQLVHGGATAVSASDAEALARCYDQVLIAYCHVPHMSEFSAASHKHRGVTVLSSTAPVARLVKLLLADRSPVAPTVFFLPGESPALLAFIDERYPLELHGLVYVGQADAARTAFSRLKTEHQPGGWVRIHAQSRER